MRIPIVNEEDEILYYKERNDVTPDEIIRTASIWITDEFDNVLMQQRKFTKKKNPGKWGPAAAGTVEKDETYEQNIRKEVFEEIGIKDISPIPYKKFFGKTNNGKRFAQVYTATIHHNTVLTIQEDEVEQMKWFSRKELLDKIESNPETFVGLMQDLKEIFLK